MAESVLFTNLYLGAYTGSELHVLKLATEFKNRGWDVTCYTFIASYPLIERFDNAGIDVIIFGEEEFLAETYDVLYAQHHVVSDYLLANWTLEFKKVIVSMLGVKTMHELPPSFARSSDLAVFVSEECRDSHACDFEGFQGTQLVMPNYADDELFERTPIDCSDLKRIAVISNHIASELLDLKDVMPSNVEICYIGVDTCAVEVTVELLETFDLVITIGRTVIACMALGIPVYCYDMFGGSGYLAIEKLDEHGYANYSGRSRPIRLDAGALWEDMQSGYASCMASLSALREYAVEHFKFSNLFDGLLSRIGSISDDLPYKNPMGSIGREYKEKTILLAALQHRNIGGLFGTACCFIRNEVTDARRTTLPIGTEPKSATRLIWALMNDSSASGQIWGPVHVALSLSKILL